jgi:hypothetical protein
MNNLMENTEASCPTEEPATKGLPDTVEPLEDADDNARLLEDYPSHNLHHSVPFFMLSSIGKLMDRPYHKVTLVGPVKVGKLAEDFPNKSFRSERVVDRSGNTKISRLLLRFEADAFACIDDDEVKIYAPTLAAAQEIGNRLRRYVKPQEAGKPHFLIIGISEFGPETQAVKMERTAPVSAEDLALHYGDDFPSWEQDWRVRLRQKPSGLSILHGPPGCGKTSYLRALMARLVDKAIFYFVPVSAADMLFDPRYVSFWIGETRRNQTKLKIVMLEDAEDLLLPRESGDRNKVSNLLNLADGFLGDHLKLQVIATTNVKVRELDPAILRPGRLLGSHEFRRLSRNEAQRLAQAKGLALLEQDNYSLAEIYNGAAVGQEFNGQRHIGFAP